MPTITAPPLSQLTSGRYTAQLVDQTGAGVPAASLTSLTLTVRDRATGTVINSRNVQNVLNTNNVTVDASGNLVWTLQPADNPIVTPAKNLSVEMHDAIWQAIWPNGRINHLVALPVANLGLSA